MELLEDETLNAKVADPAFEKPVTLDCESMTLHVVPSTEARKVHAVGVLPE